MAKQSPPYVYFHLALKHCGSSPIDAIAQVSAVAETSKLLELLSDLQSEGTVRRLQNVSCLPFKGNHLGFAYPPGNQQISPTKALFEDDFLFSLEHGGYSQLSYVSLPRGWAAWLPLLNTLRPPWHH